MCRRACSSAVPPLRRGDHVLAAPGARIPGRRRPRRAPGHERRRARRGAHRSRARSDGHARLARGDLLGRPQAPRGDGDDAGPSSSFSTTSTGRRWRSSTSSSTLPRSSQEVPLLLLCMARPDLFEMRPTWTAPRPNATVLTLDPLSEEDSETLVERLGDLPERGAGADRRRGRGEPALRRAARRHAGRGRGRRARGASHAPGAPRRAHRPARRPERAVVERGSVEGAALPPRRRCCAAVRARATRGRHAPADARPQGADPTGPGDAAGRRRLPLRSHPHPRRRVRRDPQAAARRAARAVRRLAGLEGSATTRPTRSSPTTWSRRTGTGKNSVRRIQRSAAAPPRDWRRPDTRPTSGRTSRRR